MGKIAKHHDEYTIGLITLSEISTVEDFPGYNTTGFRKYPLPLNTQGIHSNKTDWDYFQHYYHLDKPF